MNEILYYAVCIAGAISLTSLVFKLIDKIDGE